MYKFMLQEVYCVALGHKGRALAQCNGRNVEHSQKVDVLSVLNVQC
jgi:hypothetical protein